MVSKVIKINHFIIRHKNTCEFLSAIYQCMSDEIHDCKATTACNLLLHTPQGKYSICTKQIIKKRTMKLRVKYPFIIYKIISMELFRQIRKFKIKKKKQKDRSITFKKI